MNLLVFGILLIVVTPFNNALNDTNGPKNISTTVATPNVKSPVEPTKAPENNTTPVPITTLPPHETTTKSSTPAPVTTPSTTAATNATTTPTPVKPSTTPASHSTTTNKPPSTTTENPTSPSSTVTVPVPNTSSSPVEPVIPVKGRHFDGLSFMGGIILTACLVGLSVGSYKFYKIKTEQSYLTL